MDGDIAPLPDLVEVAERHGAIMMVDDAHASGVLGTQGAGTVDHFGLHGRVDVQVGTLSKAIGVLGVRRRARRPDRVAAQPRAPVPVLDERRRPRRRPASRRSTSSPTSRTHRAAVDQHAVVQGGLARLGFDTGESETPITPVITGEEEATQAFARRLFEEGVFCPAIVFPTVARGRARVRTIVTADHAGTTSPRRSRRSAAWGRSSACARRPASVLDAGPDAPDHQVEPEVELLVGEQSAKYGKQATTFGSPALERVDHLFVLLRVLLVRPEHQPLLHHHEPEDVAAERVECLGGLAVREPRLPQDAERRVHGPERGQAVHRLVAFGEQLADARMQAEQPPPLAGHRERVLGPSPEEGGTRTRSSPLGDPSRMSSLSSTWL